MAKKETLPFKGTGEELIYYGRDAEKWFDRLDMSEYYIHVAIFKRYPKEVEHFNAGTNWRPNPERRR